MSKKYLLTAVSMTLAIPSAFALHPSNAGPKDFEIPIDLPPAPVLSPEEALQTIHVPDGYKVELVASEPLISDPIAMSWDAQGRLYVVEMNGYMHDIEGAGEDQPIGRIQLLEDTNDDGVMDTASLFLDNLVMPRAVMAVNGGALVAEPPNLFFCKDTDGDGSADHKEVIANDFGVKGGQPEHMANSPMWALDNWIYSSKYNSRFRFEQGEWIADQTPARGQYGLTQDNFGRLFYNSNSDFLRGDMVPAHYYLRNPNYSGEAGLAHQVVRDQTVWPSHPTPGVNRGYSGILRDDATLSRSTATCGPMIYRGDLFPEEFQGNAIIPEPAGNLVKRLVLSEENGYVYGENAYEGREFMTSTDERFRPVEAYNGPDGAIYIVDMYRGILQHTAFLTHYLIANIQERNLAQPIGLGRIYRVVPEDSNPKAVKIADTKEGLVEQLKHPNGYIRQTAQRVLVEQHDPAVIPALVKLAKDNPGNFARLHALWTLEGIGGLNPAILVSCLHDPHPKIQAATVRLAESFLTPDTRGEVLPDMLLLTDSDKADVLIQLAFTLSGIADADLGAQQALVEILSQSSGHEIIRDAAVSGLRGLEVAILKQLARARDWNKAGNDDLHLFTALAQSVRREGRSTPLRQLLDYTAALPAGNSFQKALLAGLAGENILGQREPRLGILYLDSKPAALETLLSTATDETKSLAQAIDSKLAWPGKEGVPPPPKVEPLTPEEQELFESGKFLYSATCAGCHQLNGLGQPGLAPPLLDSDWVLGSPDRLVRIITQGVTGPINVGGMQYRLEMPGLPFDDKSVAAVATYIRREWEHNASPISVEQVKSIREGIKDRAEFWTAEELLKIE